MASTRGSANVQNWSTGIKVGALLVMSAALLAAGQGFSASADGMWPRAITPSFLSSMGLSMIGVLWAYEGWQYVTFSAGDSTYAGSLNTTGTVSI